MTFRSLIPIAALSLSLAQACGGPVTPEPIKVEPKLSDIQAKIFSLSCATAGCHTTASANLNGKLDLTDGKSFAQLVGVTGNYPISSPLKRVEAGQPDKSLLYIKIADPDHLDLATYGAPMPNNGEPLTSQQVQAIFDWIKNGAAND